MKQPTIDINCDMGEGLENDAAIMPFITSANIACGYHAGDADIMQRTISLAIENNVAIGAHPGFADKQNFGRKEIQLPLNEVFDLVTAQVNILSSIALKSGSRLHHVKPHGALYNMSARDPLLANTIAKAVCAVDPSLLLVGLSGSCSISEAGKAGLSTMSEVFADRTYRDDGSLTPRSERGALIDDQAKCIAQVLQMARCKTVTSISGNPVSILAETICIHGDGLHAVEFAKAVFESLQSAASGVGQA